MANHNEVHPSTMEELIFKYLNKTLTQEENEQLKSWLELREENRVTLNKLSSFYKNDESKLPMMKQVVWSEIHQKLGDSGIPSTSNLSIGWGMMLKIAAVFLLVSAVAIFAYRYSLEPSQQEVHVVNTIVKEAPLGSKITTKLPDGSIVTLNSGTKISFPERFQGAFREVSLIGEAFFEVEHNPKMPFLVHMTDDVVKVLGTSFNIRSYEEDSAVYVSVATGPVSYSIPSGDEVVLEPHRMATYLPKKGSLTTGEVDELRAFGWKDKVLYFDDITLDKAVVELERWYGVKIDYKVELDSHVTYSEQFTNPTLLEVLHSLSFVYRFDFKIEGKKVTLNKITT